MDNKNLIISFLLIISFHLAFSQNYSEQAQLANEYYVEGELDKASDLFEKLSKNKSAIPLIHSNYLAYLVNRQEYNKAEKYMREVLKYYPSDFNYMADVIYLFDKAEDDKAKGKYIEQLYEAYGSNQYQLSLIAQHLVNRDLLEEARDFYLKARAASGSSNFALDLASVYRMIGDKDQMTEEYLRYATNHRRNTRYIKNVFQQLMSEPEDLDYLESTLIKKIQNYPNNIMYLDLIVWVELQRKNFYGAYLQSRALDKRMGNPGTETLRIGRIALENKSYKDAMDIFEYVAEEYGKGAPHYVQARQLYTKAKEGLILNTFPVDTNKVASLTREYQQLYDDFGPTHITLEALRSKARLLAFFLNKKDEAILSLKEIINTSRMDSDIRDNAKLDLGDIYLLKGEPWEATLLYSQVEKANKYAVIGYTAKLKNAKLNYYTGNFALAKSHLDILKNATTKEIANDAIDLSVLIKNNTVLDTTDAIMEEYAAIDLLLYQNRNAEAKERLETFLNNHPFHSLIDEVYWLLADLELAAGNYENSITYLDEILAEFPQDILGDDAFFLKAEITEKYLDQTQKASDLYRDFLTSYPGSMYVAEARKRFRKLRGDEIN